RSLPSFPTRRSSDLRDKLYQLLRNILDNALRHTPAGGAVEMGLGSDGASVQIRVADTGPGIPDEEIARVFDRRFQGQSSSGSGGDRKSTRLNSSHLV